MNILEMLMAVFVSIALLMFIYAYMQNKKKQSKK